MTAGPEDGRFGPVYLGRDSESGRAIVIRTFSETMTVEQHSAFAVSLSRLCEQPLEHPSIARALEGGVEDGVPYIAHEALPGTPVDEYLELQGPMPLAEVVRRVTQLAEAFDLAAAAGVHHGALGPRDVAFHFDETSVAGFGLTQALREAGVDSNEPSLADDIYALAAMAFELLVGRRYEGGDVRAAVAGLADSRGVREDALARALESALAPDPRLWPPTAQEFAASLRRAAMPAGGGGASRDETVGRLALGDDTAPAASAASSMRTPPREPDVPRAPLELSALEETPLLMFEPEASHPEPEPLPPAPSDPPFEETVFHEPAFSEPVLREPDTVPLQTPTYDPPPRMTPRTPVVAPGLLRPDVRPTFQKDPSNARVFAVVVIAAVVLLGAVGTGIFLAQRSTNDAADTSAPAPVTGTQESTPAPQTQAQGNPSSGAVTAPAAGAPASPSSGAGNVAQPSLPATAGLGTGSPASGSSGSASAPGNTASGPGAVSSPGAASGPSNSASVPAGAAGGAPAAAPGVSPTTRPDAAANTHTGRLLVRSTPAGALVVVDGQPRGETPLVLRGLEFGSHTISVTGAGLPRWERRVTLTPEHPSESFEIGGATGEGSPVAPEGPASLQVDSRPAGARVYVDGRIVGATPLLLPNVTPGSHMIRIELLGYRPWTTSVVLTRGVQSRVGASLEP